MGAGHLPDRDSKGHAVNTSSPFGAKEIDGKKLFKRVNGMRKACIVGWNDFYFTIPYPVCKITGAEFVGAEIGDYADFWILDTASGALTTIPNYPLNQFGIEVNIGKDLYEHKSEYDADLFQGLQIWARFYSISAKTVGVNFILNELKD